MPRVETVYPKSQSAETARRAPGHAALCLGPDRAAAAAEGPRLRVPLLTLLFLTCVKISITELTVSKILLLTSEGKGDGERQKHP